MRLRHQYTGQVEKNTKFFAERKIGYWNETKKITKPLNLLLHLLKVEYDGVGIDYPLWDQSISVNKALPGTMTEQAKFNRPVRDCTSLKVAFLRCKNSIRGAKHLLSLSGGKGVSISTESNAIPANDVVVKGLKVFFQLQWGCQCRRKDR